MQMLYIDNNRNQNQLSGLSIDKCSTNPFNFIKYYLHPSPYTKQARQQNKDFPVAKTAGTGETTIDKDFTGGRARETKMTPHLASGKHFQEVFRIRRKIVV